MCFPSAASRLWFCLLAFNAVSVPLGVVGSLGTWVWVGVCAPLLYGTWPTVGAIAAASAGMALAGVWALAGTGLSCLALECIAGAYKDLPLTPALPAHR